MKDNEKIDVYFKAGIGIREDLMKQFSKASDQGLQFVYQIITVTGLIAGFGFSGIHYLNRFYFSLGEIFLFLAILSGLVAVYFFWIDGLVSTEKLLMDHVAIGDKFRKGALDSNRDLIEEAASDFEKSMNQKKISNVGLKFKYSLGFIIVFLSLGSLFMVLSLISCF